MRGGMWSGWAASRTSQLSDTASQHPFGGWQGGHHPRWQYSRRRSKTITPSIGDGRPTWPPDGTSKPSRTKWPSEIRTTSGDLGTHAMHPPRQRRTCLWPSEKQLTIVTRGRTRRSAPTRRFCIRQAGSICYSVAMSGRIRQAENVFVAIRKAIDNRNARVDTAVRPYTEFFISDFGSMISLELRLTE
jgi:hypothetical protein